MAIVSLRWANLTIPPAASVKGRAAEVRQLTAAGHRSLIPVVYGIDRVGALVLNVIRGTGDYAQHVLVQCLWSHACDAVDEPRFGPDALPAGSTAWHYTGSQSTTNAALVAAFAAQSITYSETLAGYAYSVIALPIVSFAGRLDLSARIKGRKVYISRLDSTQPGGSGAHRLADPATWQWTDNPVDCLCDWLSNATYGAGRTVDYVNTWAAAYECDELVSSEKRRTLNISLTAQASLPDMLETLRAHAGCWVVPGSAGLKMIADTTGSSVATYAHANGDIASISPLQLRDMGNAPTVVEVTYTDTSQVPYRDAVATYSMTGAGTSLPWRVSSVRMDGVNRYSQAYREAKERLNKLRLGEATVEMEVFDIGIRHEVGDIVTVTHPLGLSSQAMRVYGVEMTNHGSWRLSLSQYSAAAYSDDKPSTSSPAAVSMLIRPLPASGSLLPDAYFAEDEWWAGTRNDSGGWAFQSITDSGNALYLGMPKQLVLTGSIGTAQKLIVSYPVESPPPGVYLRLLAKMVNTSNQIIYGAVYFYDRAMASLKGSIAIGIPAGGAAQQVWQQGQVPAGAEVMVFVAVNAGGTTFTGSGSLSGVMLEVAAGTDKIVPDAITELYASTATSSVTITGQSATTDGFQTSKNTVVRSVTFTPSESGTAVATFEGTGEYTCAAYGSARWSIQDAGGSWDDYKRVKVGWGTAVTAQPFQMSSERSFAVTKGVQYTLGVYACKLDPADTFTVSNAVLRVEVIKR